MSSVKRRKISDNPSAVKKKKTEAPKPKITPGPEPRIEDAVSEASDAEESTTIDNENGEAAPKTFKDLVCWN